MPLRETLLRLASTRSSSVHCSGEVRMCKTSSGMILHVLFHKIRTGMCALECHLCLISEVFLPVTPNQLNHGAIMPFEIHVVTGAGQGTDKLVAECFAFNKRSLQLKNSSTTTNCAPWHAMVVVGGNAKHGVDFAQSIGNLIGLQCMFQPCDLINMFDAKKRSKTSHMTWLLNKASTTREKHEQGSRQQWLSCWCFCQQ